MEIDFVAKILNLSIAIEFRQQFNAGIHFSFPNLPMKFSRIYPTILLFCILYVPHTFSQEQKDTSQVNLPPVTVSALKEEQTMGEYHQPEWTTKYAGIHSSAAG